MAQYKKSTDAKSKILRVSEELFAQNGYDATGIAEIAQKAEITKSLLYYYFESKEQILEELVSSYLLQIREEKQKIFSGNISDADAAEQSLLSGFSLLSGSKNIIRILIAELLKGNVKNEPLLGIVNSIIPPSLSSLNALQSQPASGGVSTYLFFFALAPLLSYMMFGEVWAKSNGWDKDGFAQQFFYMAEATLSNKFTGLTRDFFAPHRAAIVENLKKLL